MAVDPDTSDSRVSFEELKKLDAHFDEQLSGYRSGTRKSSGGTRFSLKKILFKLIGAFFFLVLPFFLLIRGSTFLYLEYNLNGWVALGGGVLATVLLLLLYAITVSFYFRRSFSIGKYALRAIIGLVVVYCSYSLFYFSSLNVKTEEVRSYYRSLHPILRVTLATTALADSKLIITDTRRTPSDYRKMGLPPRQESLHYVQDNGYVHAVDIRTNGRSEWINRSLQFSLQIMGFHTIRHTGTADHLHVSLPLIE